MSVTALRPGNASISLGSLQKSVLPEVRCTGLCAYLQRVSGLVLFLAAKGTTYDASSWTSNLQKCGVNCIGS